MLGETISEAEFEAWVPWPAAYTHLAGKLYYSQAKREISRRLLLGSLRAAARWTKWEHGGNRIEDRAYEVIAPLLWAMGRPLESDTVWLTGSHDFAVKKGYETLATLCQGLRLDPKGLDLLWLDAGLGHRVAPTLPTEPELAAGFRTPSPTKSLASAEYANLGRAIAAGWGTSLTEDEAWQLAKRVFPDHKVSRDPFLAQYREHRPDKKRGKQPLSD
jgi:hypothetical protein